MRFLLAVSIALISASAHAGDIPLEAVTPPPGPLPAEASEPFIDEIRFGASGIVNDVVKDDDENAYLHFEALFNRPTWEFESPILTWFMTPRPTVGTALSATGGTSMAYAGFTWDYRLTKRIFLEGFFGGAIHNGETDEDEPDKRYYGCTVNFREGAGIGFDITEKVNVIAFWDHMSNGQQCSDNDGITRLGAKVGYKF